MALKGFERRLENMVEGVFARVFRSGLRPVEIGRRLAREIDTSRSVDVRGHTVVPNAFVVRLSVEDADRFAEIADSLARELADAVREHCREEGYRFKGPVDVQLTADPKIRTGDFRVDGRMRQGRGGVGAGSVVLPNGDRYILGDHLVTIGRLPECEVTINDTNVSRHHAQIRASGDGFQLVDLGSTNGSRVNGSRVSQHDLVDGDEVTFGGTTLIFEAS